MQNEKGIRNYIRMEVRFKNNLILKKMEDLGIKNVRELCSKMGIKNAKAYAPSVYEIINMRRTPFGKRGEWAKPVIKMCEFFKCVPEELFSAEQTELVLKKNQAVVEVSLDSVRILLEGQQQELLSPEDVFAEQEMRAIVNKALQLTLSSRERLIIQMRFGIDSRGERTQEEVATAMGISVARVGQIERKAMRVLHREAHRSFNFPNRKSIVSNPLIGARDLLIS